MTVVNVIDNLNGQIDACCYFVVYLQSSDTLQPLFTLFHQIESFFPRISHCSTRLEYLDLTIHFMLHLTLTNVVYYLSTSTYLHSTFTEMQKLIFLVYSLWYI